MFDLSTTNNWLNYFPDHALMTVSNRKENGVSILSVYHNSFPKLEGQADPLLHKFHWFRVITGIVPISSLFLR